jgi:hypothetical protein
LQEIHNGLRKLLEYPADDVADSFALTFEISYKTIYEEVLSHELKPGGASLIVTNENRQGTGLAALALNAIQPIDIAPHAHYKL